MSAFSEEILRLVAQVQTLRGEYEQLVGDHKHGLAAVKRGEITMVSNYLRGMNDAHDLLTMPEEGN
jgi:hypothetical protein